MHTATGAERNAPLPTRTTSREARRWIERQLRWEHTLGHLRNQGTERAKRAA